MSLSVPDGAGPAEFYRRFHVRVRKSVARRLHARGIGCSQCDAPMHHMFVHLEATPPRPGAAWGYEHVGWLDWVDSAASHAASAASGAPLCAYHAVLDRVRRRAEPWSPVGPDCGAVDVAPKRELHTTLLRGMGGACASCARPPDPVYGFVGFDANHIVCKRAGGPKDRALSYYWLEWGCASTKQRALNLEALRMPIAVARPLMVHEASLCNCLCRTCHERTTDTQNGTVVDWSEVQAWLSDRVAPAVVRALCGYPDVLEVTLGGAVTPTGA